MFTINGETWTVIYVSPDDPALQRSDGSIALGMCYDKEKVIYMSNMLLELPSLHKKVLCHEITHAAMFSYNVDLDYTQEELVADLIATYGEEIIEVTNRIFSHLCCALEDYYY